MNFSLGRCLLELAQEPSRVALALHKAGSSTPFWVTMLLLTLNLLLRCVDVSFLFNNLAFSQHECVDHFERLILLSLRKGQ
jgi:hypothetical protein